MYEHLHFINDAFAVNVGTEWSSTSHFTSNGELHVCSFLLSLKKMSISLTKVLVLYKFEKFGFYT